MNGFFCSFVKNKIDMEDLQRLYPIGIQTFFKIPTDILPSVIKESNFGVIFLSGADCHSSPTSLIFLI